MQETFPLLVIVPHREDGDFDLWIKLGPKRSQEHFIARVSMVKWELPTGAMMPMKWTQRVDAMDTAIHFAAHNRLPGSRKKAYISRREFSRLRKKGGLNARLHGTD